MNRLAGRARRGCSDLIRSLMRTATALAVLTLSGCAHHDPVFSPAELADDTRALIYIYRPARFSNAALSPSVLVDGEAVFNTENGAYAYLYLAAGTHVFVLEGERHFTGNDEIEVQLESAQVSYLRVDTELRFETDKPYTRSFGLVRVDEATALSQIAECHRQEPRLPSKYLWSAEARDETGDEVQSSETATYSIDKGRDPFAGKRTH